MSRAVIEAIRASPDFLTGTPRIVAYSGGVDSTVLLHALVTYANLRPPALTAIHVDHGLHALSKTWAADCVERAAALGIPCGVAVIDAHPVAGKSVETWAREMRYGVFERATADGGLLVMAHHLDDLAETFLLRLMRGAGPDGLAGMPATRPLGRGHLQRPLLGVRRSEIEAYARTHELVWSEDPANEELSHDRNYVRHRVIPALQRRWPAAVERIGHAAVLQSTAAGAMRERADAILESAVERGTGTLALAPLSAHETGMQRTVLRRWLERLGLPCLESNHLDELLRLGAARGDANPVFTYGRTRVRRYRDHLYADRMTAGDPDLRERRWDVNEPLKLAWGELRAVAARGVGLAESALSGRTVTVGFRHGGERCSVAGRGNHQLLKHLFQQWGVPPWQRADTPLVFVDGELAAVAGFCVCEPFGASPAEPGLRIVWSRRD